jgi:hypothetical protein
MIMIMMMSQKLGENEYLPAESLDEPKGKAVGT